MEIVFKIVVSIIAGFGAGLGTGFAGMSAAAVIIPVLVGILDMDPYMAIGIALASDVLASAFSAVTYAKNKNVDLKKSWILMTAVLVSTVIGSIVGEYLPDTILGGASIVSALILGIKFLVKPVTEPKTWIFAQTKGAYTVNSIIAGTMIGFICGCVGAGGGLAMLFVLTIVLGFDLKKAVGTSVFIMTFSALFGAVSHFALDTVPDPLILITCIASTLFFAVASARIANRIDHVTLNRVVGILLLSIGVSIGTVQLLKFLI